MKTLPGDRLQFVCTGREIDPHKGIIGLGIHSDSEHYFLEVYEGYDAPLFFGDMTVMEREELAQFMIERWKEWGRIK